MTSSGVPPTSISSDIASESPDAATQSGTPRARITAQPSRVVKCYLSILVPAYNEEKRLPATLETIADYLQKRDFSHELIVIDDGSRDKTREVVREFAASRPWVRLVQYDDEHGAALNRGKGFAVRAGVETAVGRDILFSDADLSTPIEEIEKLLPPISRGDCDISIASRALPGSNLAKHQPAHRELMGRTFNKIVQKMAVPGILDTQCGFKAFRGDVAKRLFKISQIDGFGFDPEILFLANKFGYKIRELPVTWRHCDNSRVNPMTAPIAMLRELFEIRWNDARGLYDEI
ncbi:dolichyl-phosphate beta-glucosyltransferase [Abditibacterium utsteinense]|uniref:dolichyl-phosphate beta-glucosyltransferase n=1 Tax=Abditibacterium utsteinense TaxID=1960156 RepID=A0A2S8SQ98_9BACT|nr:dolichyl-phosphate beta-glucosyltransferase [Abditibacterium utsteinense]PQV62970.1 dolichyl-phosphate beta-glucosyltransferase [Abditibacterium utsteinense]